MRITMGRWLQIRFLDLATWESDWLVLGWGPASCLVNKCPRWLKLRQDIHGWHFEKRLFGEEIVLSEFQWLSSDYQSSKSRKRPFGILGKLSATYVSPKSLFLDRKYRWSRWLSHSASDSMLSLQRCFAELSIINFFGTVSVYKRHFGE